MTHEELVEVNKTHRRQDESGRPICGRFNVAERAIRQAGKFRRAYGDMSAEEYDSLLSLLESTIVNDSRNW